MTTLSDEQMNFVSGAGISAWEDCALPTGRHPLPEWCLDAHVDWGNGHCGAPSVSLKVRGDAYRWPDQRFRKEGSKLYIARHEDGRAVAHYHGGALSREKLLDRRGPDGKYIQLVADCKEVEVLATTQQDGYAGAHYWLTMEDGSDLVLRGPWHGGAPEGYVEVSAFNVESSLYHDKWSRARPWYERGGGPGVYITEDLFMRIVSRFCAHARVARVVHSYGVRLEPYRAEWGMSKAAIYEVERSKAQLKMPAGPHWRVYWDGTKCYCGSLRVPTHGYSGEVHDGDKASPKEIEAAAALRARRGF